MACLWDTSNKTFGNINFYNRETNEWYDEKIKNIFYDISRGKYIKPSEYYIMTNSETVETQKEIEGLTLKIGNRKPVKIVLNVKIHGRRLNGFEFGIMTFDKNDNYIDILYGKENAKKQYDGTYIITIEAKNKDYSNYIQIFKYYGKVEVTFNNLTVEFEDYFLSFDYKSYKSRVLNTIN